MFRGEHLVSPAYFVGLDLGQAQEYTAVAALERWRELDPEGSGRQVNFFAVRYLERFALGTSYTAVGERLAELFGAPPLASSTLVVDQTAVGRPVVQMLKGAGIHARFRPITMTVGHHAGSTKGSKLVPRKEIVSTLQVLLQSRRIKVAEALPEAALLVQELANFKAKVSLAADDGLESWREGPHDDLVLAVAIAAWQGEHQRDFVWFIGGLGGDDDY
jgi:hypothetical protein